jgi:biotin carboxyl carrier protein
VQYEVEIGGRRLHVAVTRTSDGFAVSVDGRTRQVNAARIDGYTLSLLVDEWDGLKAVPYEPVPTNEASPNAGSSTVGDGLRTVGSSTVGDGLRTVGSSTVGDGLRTVGSSTVGDGLQTVGSSTVGDGLQSVGSSTVGDGLQSVGSSTVGDGLQAVPSDTAQSHEVSIAADPVSGQLAVHVGNTPVTVTLNGRRRWSRKDDGAGSGSGPQRLVAPMPGKVVRVLVKGGDRVAARQPVVVVEAMKMENELRASREGTIAEIHVREGMSVDAGALLVVIQ